MDSEKKVLERHGGLAVLLAHERGPHGGGYRFEHLDRCVGELDTKAGSRASTAAPTWMRDRLLTCSAMVSVVVVGSFNMPRPASP